MRLNSKNPNFHTAIGALVILVVIGFVGLFQNLDFFRGVIVVAAVLTIFVLAVR